MSNVKIQGNASGTGSLTIAAPNTSTDRTLTLPDQTGTMMATGGGPINVSTSAAADSVVVDASGQLGVGTVSPYCPLEIVGDGTVARFTGSGGQFQGFGVRNNYASASNMGSNFYDALNESGVAVANMVADINTDGSSVWYWTTQPSGARTDRRVERMRINYDGRVFFNTTGGIGSGVQNVQIGTGVLDLGTAYKANVDGNWACAFFNAAGSVVGNIVIGSSSTSYNTSSDYRLKNTIAPMTGALAKVAALKPCTYKWNADGADGEGFIAHELAEVCPQAVTGEKDAVDDEGNPKYQGIDTSFLVATLTAAIQEQQAIITALTARIEALEA